DEIAAYRSTPKQNHKLSLPVRKTKLCLVLYLQPHVMVSCLFGAESSLRLLACRGRTTPPL
ncbi:hypothetical protein, partial [Sporolactobacillus terrae]|uniref:hypothetical protein n=1 Tax=Sporolactobacillus terrae TaxID=269673 RepID=UPI00055AFF4D